MKKLFLSAILLIFVNALYAQEGTTNIGFNVGFAEPTEYYRPNNSTDKLSKNVTNGVKIGAIYETNLIKGFGVSMSLNYAFSANVGAYQPINVSANQNGPVLPFSGVARGLAVQVPDCQAHLFGLIHGSDAPNRA